MSRTNPWSRRKRFNCTARRRDRNSPRPISASATCRTHGYRSSRPIISFDRIQIPVCNVGGWFDIFAQGTIDNFVGLPLNEFMRRLFSPTGALVRSLAQGYEALLLDSIIRTRYRNGLDREVMMKPGEVARVRIDLGSTAIVFNKGHRIALHLSSSNDPRFDANPNTGHPQRADGETRVAHNTIHFAKRYPSRLLLPVIRR